MPPWRWGVFLRRPCAGLLLGYDPRDNEPMAAIYNALKQVGFRETYWQVVYPGQIGGLIKNPRSKLLEYHVRLFYDGRIYAELELGRAALLHFIPHRHYLNEYIVSKIHSRLSQPHLDYLRRAIDRHMATHRRNWPEWSMENRFVTPRIRMQLRFLTVLSDWRFLALAMLAGFAASISHGPTVVSLLVVLMIVVYLLAPKRH